MHGLLYYIPGRDGAASETLLDDTGLEAIFTKADYTRSNVRNGPGDSGPGVIIGYSGRVGYYPDDQLWTEFDRHFIGIVRGAAPGPDDLARAEFVEGYPVPMGDGNPWVFPMIRSFAGQSSLPSRLRLGPGRTWVSEVLPEYSSLCDRVEHWHDVIWDCFVSERRLPKDPALIDLVIDALAVNYRVRAEEVSVLGLLAGAKLFQYLAVLIDAPTRWREEHEEKKTETQAAAIGSPSSNGEEG
jgi:hypothetical protein